MYIPCSVECNQLADGVEVVELFFRIAVEMFMVFRHSNHVQAFTENVVDKELIGKLCVHKGIVDLYPGFHALRIIVMVASGLRQTAFRRRATGTKL